jgi:peptidoglycan glycosyltransferase
MMQPYLVSNITDSNNHIIKTYRPKQLTQAIDKKTAEQLKSMMIEVINNGTGSKAKTSQYSIAGKTGTAQNSKGRDHAWFIGFAPADNPQVAIAVLIENGGGGGTTAAPIAGRILRKAITLLK